MFGAMRRCPATLSRTLSSAAFSPRITRSTLPVSSTAIHRPAARLPAVASAAFHQSAKWRQVEAAQAEDDHAAQAEDGHAGQEATKEGPVTRFADLATRGLVHPNLVNTIVKQMKLENMTDVQSRTINEALSGVDIIAQAKTGTGKTLGFLIPTIQRIIQNDPKLGEKTRGYKRARPDDIRAIIISPTRELAEQIAVEAKKVTQNTGLVVQIAVGGTMKKEMLRKTQREGCHLMIGTPGRLNDIFADEYSGISAPNLNALVLDEADRLLDQGFTEEIDQIKEHLPNPEEVPRQTLMFSATVARDVVDLVRRTLKPGFHFARCVNENEEPTHERIPQKMVAVEGFENIMPALYELIQTEVEQSRTGDGLPFKAIIYFNSTAEVTLAASVFYKLAGGFKRNKPLSSIKGYEIHSKLSQNQRTRAAEQFRFAKSAILFSSDVTARGMDFPNVSHVIQVGIPRDRESYIHRLGRTGRAGKEGQGWLIVTPFERNEIPRRLRGLPITPDNSIESAKVDMSQTSDVPAHVNTMFEECLDAHKRVYPDQLETAFRALFGSFQWYPAKQQLLEGANRLAEIGWGMSNPPPPPASLFSGGGRRGGFGRSGGDRGGRGMSHGGRPGGFGDRSDRGGQPGGFGDRGDRGGRPGGFGDRGDRGGRPGGFGDRGDRGGRPGGFGDRGDRGGRSGGFGDRGNKQPWEGRGSGRHSFERGGRSGGGRNRDFDSGF